MKDFYLLQPKSVRVGRGGGWRGLEEEEEEGWFRVDLQGRSAEGLRDKGRIGKEVEEEEEEEEVLGYWWNKLENGREEEGEEVEEEDSGGRRW